MDTGQFTYDSIRDLKLNNIDYKWLKNCNKVPHLRRALQILKDDGNYYPDLAKQIQEKLETLDPSARIPDNEVSKEETAKETSDLYDFLEQQEKDERLITNAREKENQIFEGGKQPGDGEEMNEVEKKYAALNEKNKGNEAFRSKDFQEAKDYYTKSLEMFKDEKVYSNRAAVCLKLKHYRECIDDSTTAISMDNNFLKPYFRRGQAYQALTKYKEAIDDYQFILSKDPKNKKVTQKLKKCRTKWQKKKVQAKHLPKKMDKIEEKEEEVQEKEDDAQQFRRIQIQEESDDSDSSEENAQIKAKKTKVMGKKKKLVQEVKQKVKEKPKVYTTPQWPVPIHKLPKCVTKPKRPLIQEINPPEKEPEPYFTAPATQNKKLAEEKERLRLKKKAEELELQKKMEEMKLQKKKEEEEEARKKKEEEARKKQEEEARKKKEEEARKKKEPSAKVLKLVAKIKTIKAGAVQHLKKGMFENSIEEYKKCLNVISKHVDKEGDDDLLTFTKAGCLNNIALCYKNLQMPGKTIHYATQALNMGVDDKKLLIKAHLRRGYAFEERDKLGHAKKDFVAIKMLDPGNMDASRGLYRISTALQEKKAEREEYDRLQEAKAEKHEQADNPPPKKKAKPTPKKQPPKKTETPKPTQPKKKSKFTTKKTGWETGEVPEKAEPFEVPKSPHTQKQKNKTTKNVKAEYTDYHKMKDAGNRKFKKKKYRAAREHFEKVISEIKQDFYGSKLESAENAHIKLLYLQLHTNKAMCSHKLGEYSESVIDCNKVLKHDPTNSKALYRRALAFVGLSDKSNKSQKLSVKKSQMELLSKARSDLKKLILKDPKNKTALKKLKEFESKILKNALIIKKLQAQEKENKKAEQERAAQQQQKAQPKKPQQPKETKQEKEVRMGKRAKKQQEYMQDVKENVQNKVQEALLLGKNKPTTSQEFSRTCQIFKDVPDKLWVYMKSCMTPKDILKFYKRLEMEAETLIRLVGALNEGSEDDPDLCVEYLSAFIQTPKFSMVRRFLTKREKLKVATLVKDLETFNISVDELDNVKKAFKIK